MAVERCLIVVQMTIFSSTTAIMEVPAFLVSFCSAFAREYSLNSSISYEALGCVYIAVTFVYLQYLYLISLLIDTGNSDCKI